MPFIKICLTAFTFLAMVSSLPVLAEEAAPDSLNKSTLIKVDQADDEVHIYVEGKLVLIVDESGLRVKGKIAEVETFDEEGGKVDE